MPYNTSAIPPRKDPTGQTQLPLSRVKKIINQDTDVHTCSNNAAFVITLAAEMFIQHLAEEANTQARLERKPRRNIQYKDVANAVSHRDNLEFLEDIVPKTTPFKKIKASAEATQSRLRAGELVAAQSTLPSATNGSHRTSDAATNDARRTSAAYLVPLRLEDGEDPNHQLELETRQAGDVRMSG